jgi:Na+/phosphate symporter
MSIYYVYAYVREDHTPYYIGKGKDKRAWQSHKRSNGSDMLPTDQSRIIILHENLSESQAFALEKQLIEHYGRIDLGTGILRNLTEGGEGNRRTDWSHSDEARANMSKAKLGKSLSKIHKQALSEGQTRRWEDYDSTERDKKISESLKGRVIGCNKKKSEAAKNRKRQAWTGKKRPTKTCPHCQKTGADYLMTRWHFDNCKTLKSLD